MSDITAELARLRAALQEIRDTCGRVCADFETCNHPACQDSYGAWAIADAALLNPTMTIVQKEPK